MDELIALGLCVVLDAAQEKIHVFVQGDFVRACRTVGNVVDHLVREEASVGHQAVEALLVGPDAFFAEIVRRLEAVDHRAKRRRDELLRLWTSTVLSR